MNHKIMKIHVGALALTVLMTTAMIGTTAAAAGKDVDNVSSATVKQTQEPVIGVEAAKKAALIHAGVKAKEVVFTKAELDTEDDVTLVYDVEFATKTSRYDYEIGAVDSSVYEYSKKAISKTSVSQNAKPKENTQTADVITEDAAQKAALKHAGFTAAEVTLLWSKLDDEHGTLVYDVQFTQDGMEYEYELNAKTGAVLTWESEWD